MATEDLRFRFVEEGLSQLRRAFARTEEDLRNIDDATEASNSALDELGRDGSASAERLRDSLDAAAREAQVAEGRLEDVAGVRLSDIENSVENTGQALRTVQRNTSAILDPLDDLGRSIRGAELGFRRAATAAETTGAAINAFDAQGLTGVVTVLAEGEDNLKRSTENARAFTRVLKQVSAAAADVRNFEFGKINTGPIQSQVSAAVKTGGQSGIASLIGDLGIAASNLIGLDQLLGVTKLQGQLQDVRSEFGNTQGEVQGLRQRVEELRDAVARVTNLATQLEIAEIRGSGNIEQLSAQLEDARQRLEELRSELSDDLGEELDVSFDQGTLRLDAGPAQREIDELEDELEELDDEASSLEAEVDGRKSEGVLEGLKRQAKELTEKLTSIPGIGIGQIGSKLQELGRKLQSTGEEAQGLAARLKNKVGNALESLGGKISGAGNFLGGFQGKAAGAALAAGTLAAALVGAAVQAGKLARELQSVAARAGTLPSKIQELAQVNEILTGVESVDAAGEFLKEFSLRLEEATTSASAAREGYQRLGISVEELKSTLSEGGRLEVLDLVVRRLREANVQQRALAREDILGGQASEEFSLFLATANSDIKEIRDVAEQVQFDDDEISIFASIGRQASVIWDRILKIVGELILALQAPLRGALFIVDKALQGISLLFDGIEQGATLTVRALVGLFDKVNAFFGGSDTFLEDNLDSQTYEIDAQFAGGPGTNSLIDEDAEQGLTDLQRRLGQAFGEFETSKRSLEDDLRRGLIGKAAFLEDVADLRRQIFEDAREVDFAFEDADLSNLVDKLFEEYEKALARIPEEDAAEIKIPLEAVPVRTQSNEELANEIFEDVIDQRAAEQKLQDEMAAFVNGSLDWYEPIVGLFEAAEEPLQEAFARSIDEVFRGLGQGVAEGLDKLFTGFGGSAQGRNNARLDIFGAKEQIRSLKESLREGSISYREFSLRIRSQQLQLKEAQEALNEELESGFINALDSIGQFAKETLKTLIAEITAVIAKMAALKAITSIFNISSGSFFGGVITQLGGGGFLSTAAPSPANLTVNVTGQTRTDGRDIVTTYNSTSRTQRRQGRK